MRSWDKWRLALLHGLLPLVLMNEVKAVEEALAPERASGWQHVEVVEGERALVVTAHPLATEAGMVQLKAGGSAVDAAVAVQAMLTLVEPQSSGIGGGAFMLYWDAGSRTLHALDGREAAPGAADEGLFLQPNGEPITFWQALVGGRAVGVPGVLAMLDRAHDQFGKRPWHVLFEDAIRRAEEGFTVSPRLHRSIASEINPGLRANDITRRYFFPAGQPLAVGDLLRNPELAVTLAKVAEKGVDEFYQGRLARDMVAAVQSHPNPGRLSLADLTAYRAIERQPLCRAFRDKQLCSMPPPTSGGVALLQITGLLEPLLTDVTDSQSVDFLHLFTQASRLAYADRARYLADADVVPVPVDALLAPAYLAQRRQLIDQNVDMGPAQPGDLAEADRSEALSLERPSTTHFVIVDADGNALSMTSSIEMAFGSTLMVGGFLLNNQLTDFSFNPQRAGLPVANRVQPGKRPRSSMTPVMVLGTDGEPELLLGSPGGSRIINYVAQALLGALVGGESLQQAVNAPHISNRNSQTELEVGRVDDRVAEALERRGHPLKRRELNSGLHGAQRTVSGAWRSAVDPRREGTAAGF